ncbi:phosphatase PAP2 family protein [Thermaurantimonas aggregans]|uniref:phosphatase PAP2 family protein n=1 Tax=Thermaurantimonas aggregans TaxID=2173829 RepID=UPI00135BAEA4|nr:phosphatase PAP2 family protein [Thermaurantimonas aggregans]MCX8148901.1 phosphatase PAP2 family protein [Thermaurantimonas aggregans]
MRGFNFYVLLIFLLTVTVCAQPSNFPFRLTYSIDVSIVAGNIALIGANTALKAHLNVPTDAEILQLDRERLFYLDRITFRTFNTTTERASHYAMLSTIALPVLLAPYSKSFSQLSTMAVMGIETYSTTLLVVQTLKTLTRRPRPEMFTNAYDISRYRGIESLNSFPSGHTAMAFAAAGFVHACQEVYKQQNSLATFLMYSTYAAAITSGFLRYYSGVHHLTDVITGAALGWSIGYFIPKLHLHIRRSNQSFLLTPSPSGVIHCAIKF